MKIEHLTTLTPALEQEISLFLDQSPLSTGVSPDHHPAWLRILHSAFHHQPHILLARQSSAADSTSSGSSSASSAPIIGYLPLALVQSFLFGKFLVSLPYLNRAGILTADPAAASALIAAAADLADQLNVQYLELRHGTPSDHSRLNAQRDDKVRMLLDLPPDPEALWKSFDPKVRNQIRKGDKSNFTIAFGGLELLDPFYHVFSINMRDLGTPVYSPKLFTQILTHLPQHAQLVVVHYQQQPAAGALLIHDPGSTNRPSCTQVPSASSLRQFNATNVNMWMYHQLLLQAIQRSSKQFDFGRSSVDSGTYKFKKQWGAQPHPTVWQYYLRRGQLNSMRPDNPKQQRRIEIWKRLPLWFTRLAGPHIVRGIP